MTEQAKVPAIRFAGFTDPWEQRQLGELVTTTIGGGTPSTSNPAYWDGEIPWIQSSNVLEDTLFDVDIPKAITQKGLEESAAQIVPENSIAVVTHVGVGKLIYLPFQYSTSQDFISLCGLKGDARYTCYALWKRLQEDLHIVQGSAIKGITKEDLLEKNLPMPSVEEQAQIGVLFSQLDNLITLHQRKYDKLVVFKKSMLEKMFPKDGESVPEIRFAGFTDPWEQRKFSDMYEVNNERNTDCKLGYDRTLSIATMTFNGGNGAADDSLNSYKVIRVGDIAFEGHANKVHAYGRFVLNDAGDGLMSPRFSCLRPIVEQRYSFWKYYIPYEETMRPILVKATKSGTMMNELVPDDLMRESILVPCLAEQEAIGDCLSQLDSLITLHQRKRLSIRQRSPVWS